MKNYTRRFRPEICRGMENNPVDPARLQHCLMDSQKDHPVIQPAHYRLLTFASKIHEVTKKKDKSLTCTEFNLDVMKPSVILGTNSSNKLGASPFKYGTDATNLDHSPKR